MFRSSDFSLKSMIVMIRRDSVEPTRGRARVLANGYWTTLDVFSDLGHISVGCEKKCLH